MRFMEEWIQKYGTPALKRALAEKYSVEKGISDILVSQLEEALDHLTVVLAWLESEERTSPTAESFAKRDVVVDSARELPLPAGWSVTVSRISRITLTDLSKVTGVFVSISDSQRKLVRRAGVLFE